MRRQLQESTRTRATVEFRVQHADGEVRWISSQLHINTADDGSGRPGPVIGVTRDITEAKNAEEKVKRINVDLERRVQQRTAELSAANEELESFAYTVSHDLRAPLRAMLGFCDALIEDHGETLPPQAHEYLQHVIDGSRHLGEIIEGLLTLSRSTRGSLRRDHIDLSMHAEKALRDLARTEPDRRITWTVEQGLRAYGDSRMIDAGVRNLLGNAWKYTANRADAVIRVYAEQENGELVFCVEDNGAGFSMEHAEKLFQPFQRLHRQDEFSGLASDWPRCSESFIDTAAKCRVLAHRIRAPYSASPCRYRTTGQLLPWKNRHPKNKNKRSLWRIEPYCWSRIILTTNC